MRPNDGDSGQGARRRGRDAERKALTSSPITCAFGQAKTIASRQNDLKTEHRNRASDHVRRQKRAMGRLLISLWIPGLLASGAMAEDASAPLDITDVEYVYCEIRDEGEALFAVHPREAEPDDAAAFTVIDSFGGTNRAQRAPDGFYVILDNPPSDMLKFNEERIIWVSGSEVATGSCLYVTEAVQPVTDLILESRTGESIEQLQVTIEDLRGEMGPLKADLARATARLRAARRTLRQSRVLLGEEHLAEVNTQIAPCWRPESLGGDASDQVVTVAVRILANGQVSGLSSHIDFLSSRDVYLSMAADHVENALTECRITLDGFQMPNDVTAVLHFDGKQDAVTSVMSAR